MAKLLLKRAGVLLLVLACTRSLRSFVLLKNEENLKTNADLYKALMTTLHYA